MITVDLDLQKSIVIDSIIERFDFADDASSAENPKTKEQKIAHFLENFSEGVLGIADQYRFSNSDDLMLLLQGLADEESKGVTYWDYIEVDTLLSLQKTKTNYPDEVIFIAYHQIHELYFKLIIQELEKITCPSKFENFVSADPVQQWQNGLQRVVRYMNKLIGSIDVLKYGLSNVEFSKFRKSLLPASGFQTHQFRLIEIMLTPFEYLIKSDVRKATKPADLTLEKHFDDIYWRSAVMTAGQRGKILVNFNAKYDRLFTEQLKYFSTCNLYFKYLAASDEFRDRVKDVMIRLEESILMWKITHLKAVRAHIPIFVRGTGGVHWSEYLEVKNQKIYYFPVFWEGLDTSEKLDKKIKEIEDNYPDKIMQELKEIWKDVQV